MFFKKKTKKIFLSPYCGNIMPLCEIPDPVFAEGLMGDGFAVELTEGKVVAPFDGKIAVCYPTGHAIGLVGNDGIECLLHIGIDTVKLKGDGFDVKVIQGQNVKTGDTLVIVNCDLIKNLSLSLVSPVVFTDGTKIKRIKKSGVVSLLDDVIEF